MSVTISPPMVFQFSIGGQPAIGYQLFTYVSNTSTKQATWTDYTQGVLNSNPIKLDSNGAASVWLDPTLTYKYVLTTPNDTDPPTSSVYSQNGIQSGLTTSSLTAGIIGIVLYPRTPGEISSGVTPTNYAYEPGDPRRYGAVGGPWGSVPTANDSAPWATAVSTGYVYRPPNVAFKVISGATYTGTLTVIGAGRTSELYSDTTYLTIINGTGSTIDNFWDGNITPPWVVTRDPTNWEAVIPPSSLVQSNTQLGYQPTVNDPEYATWVASIPAVGTQNIGPVIYCIGAASKIKVSRIFGRFNRVEIRDAQYSTIEDCDIPQGGKGVWGCLEFDNWLNGIQRGIGNRIVNNRVAYTSFSGCYFAANDDFTCTGNNSYRNGESGTKTLQCNGVNFSATLAIGATSGTISVPNTGLGNGSWTFVFQDGETRSVTISGNTACTWSGGLVAASYAASAYQTTLNPQCFRGQIEDNHCYQNFYDGLDCDSTVSTTVDAALTYHQINNNYAYGNGGDGINADGQFNTYVGNHIYGNGAFGFWGLCSFSIIEGNHIVGNSVNGLSTYDLLGGIQGNSIIGNRVVFTATAGTGTPAAFFASQTSNVVPHIVADNVTVGATAFFGNPGVIYPVLSNNIDATTGARTRQSGCMILRNNAGTLQHAFQNDIAGGASAVLSRIIGNSAAFTNTPTGTDATTAFAAGAKISTTDTNGVVFNTAAQWAQDVDLEARIVNNSTTINLTVSVSFESFSVNGVTLTRPLFRFWNATSGAAFLLNTTNVGASTLLQVEFTGYLS